jgi:hypothetical protein
MNQEGSIVLYQLQAKYDITKDASIGVPSVDEDQAESFPRLNQFTEQFFG